MSEVTAYAEAVLNGEIIAGRLVCLAAERHLRDLATGHERGLWFDEDAAAFAVAFIELLPQRKGEWGGQPLKLSPWQKFRIGSVFGWKRAAGPRRFRKSYSEVARKNGKTTEAGGVGNLLAWVDDEPGAEVYVAATKRDQAKICWTESKWQLSYTAPGKPPALAPRLGVKLAAANMHSDATAAKYEPLGCDRDSTDGLNIHGLIVDELHAWKDREFWAKLQTAQGARRQPLTWIITTAGADKEGICKEEHDYAVKVLEGVIDDDSLFAFIATVDDAERWGDPVEWAKSNPNLGVSIQLEYLQQQYKEALEKPASQSSFKRFHTDIWVESENPWISLQLWDDQPETTPDAELAGRKVVLGVDLSSKTDLTALCMVFPDEDGGVDVRWRHWCPEEGIAERSRKDRVPYDAWVEQGWLTPTPGPVVDYDYIFRAITEEVATQYQVVSVGRDPWNGTELQRDLMAAGFTVVDIAQVLSRLSEPTKTIEALLMARKFRHDRNPIARWAASNAVAIEDANGNRRLDKAKSSERIDPLPAAVNAVSEWLAMKEEEAPEVTAFWA